MPPFDRRPKTPTVSRPTAGFDAPANSARIARAPWEREDDDAFGPPPALDLSPGDAESEAKRMIYEKTHPLHEAIMQNAHLDHNRAMRRYASLMRRAWDPAARNIPVKPARIIGDDGLARPAPGTQVQGAPVAPSRTSDTADPLQNDLGVRLTGSASNIMGHFESDGPNSRLSTRSDLLVAGRDGHAMGTGGLQSKSFGKSFPRPRQTTEQDGTSVGSDEQRTELQGFSRRGDHTLPLDSEVSEQTLIQRDQNRSEIAAHRRQQSLSMQNRGIRPEEQRTLPVSPHNINAQQWAEIQSIVETSSQLSAMERYVHLRLFGYEGLSIDSTDPSDVSVGGVRNSVLHDVMIWDDPETERSGDALSLYAVLKQLRALEGKSVPEWDESSVSITDLSVDEILDVQRIYLVRYLEGWTTARQVHDSTILDRLGPPEMVAQIADTIFQHGPTIAIPLLQEAVNDVIATLPAEVRERYDLTYLKSDGILGTHTRTALKALAQGPLKEAFLLALRRRRSLKLLADGNYTGNNRLRVWGLSEADVKNR